MRAAKISVLALLILSLFTPLWAQAAEDWEVEDVIKVVHGTITVVDHGKHVIRVAGVTMYTVDWEPGELAQFKVGDEVEAEYTQEKDGKHYLVDIVKIRK